MTFKIRMWMLPCIAGLIVSTGIAINAHLTTQTSHNLQTVQQVNYPAVEAVRTLKQEFVGVQEAIKQAVTEGDPAAFSVAAEHSVRYQSAITQLGKLGKVEHAASSQLAREFDAYYASAVRAGKILLNEEKGDSSAAVAAMQATAGSLSTLLSRAQQDGVQQFNQLLNASANSVQTALKVSVISAVLIIFGLWLGSFILIRSVFRDLGGDPGRAAHVVRHIATGDFSSPVPVAAGDSHSLLSSVGLLRSKLGPLIRDVHHSSLRVDGAAQHLNGAIEQLNDRTACHADSLERVASSMEEVLETARQNSNSAKCANEVALEACQRAEDGGRVVHRAVKAVSAIHDSSNRIVDIIGVMNSIAFQTNLLALNAAVEAARAGEQGRGFAVVAAEVGTLARRSATAAREIKKLIEDSGILVRDGAALVNESGEHLTAIVAAVRQVTGIVAQIATGSLQQSRSLEHINAAVAQMDGVTQQISAMSTETSSVSQSMTTEAKRLTAIVAQFKSEDTEGSLASGSRFADSIPRLPAERNGPMTLRQPIAVEWEASSAA